MSEKKVVDGLIHDLEEQKYSVHHVSLPFAKADVYFQPMRTSDQKAVVKAFESQKPHVVNRCLDELLNRLVTDWGEVGKVENLYLLDRQYLIIVVRARSKDSTIRFTPTCPQCGKKGEPIALDIDEVEVKPLPDELFQREIQLLDGKYTLLVQPPKRSQEKEKDVYAKNHPKEMDSRSLTDEAFAQLALLMQELRGADQVQALDFSAAFAVLNNLDGESKSRLDEYVQELSKYGFPTRVAFDCDVCPFDEEVVVDISDFILT